MYSQVFTSAFDKDVKAIKKDTVLYSRLAKKIKEILEKPEHYPSKKYEFRGMRGVHVGSFVIIFEIKGELVVFHSFRHHDYAYR